MKKILSLLGVFGLLLTTSSKIVACNSEKDKSQESKKSDFDSWFVLPELPQSNDDIKKMANDFSEKESDLNQKGLDEEKVDGFDKLTQEQQIEYVKNNADAQQWYLYRWLRMYCSGFLWGLLNLDSKENDAIDFKDRSTGNNYFFWVIKNINSSLSAYLQNAEINVDNYQKYYDKTVDWALGNSGPINNN